MILTTTTTMLLYSENNRRDGCDAIMQGYTDAGASDEMKKVYSECVVKVLPSETYQQPTIEAKMFVIVILIGWVISMTISTIKLKDGIFIGILGGTVFYIAFLVFASVAIASLLFILS